ncbi:MAG: 30S ribosomal protein S6 [Verrucomicrobiaceae bacterium]|nr:MAG: 30S ribosomal protein S6 [Verrucomicrobiaceae bacterium]
MKRYEALLALDTRGKEDTAKETIERLEKVLAAEGAKIEQVQRLEKRELAYESKHTKSAYYVNFIFEADPATIDKLQKKLKLDEDVLLQNYLQLPEKKAPATA